MYLMTKLFQEARLVLKYITKPKGNGLTEEKNLSSKNRKIETKFSLSEERQASETVSLNTIYFPCIPLSFMGKPYFNGQWCEHFSRNKLQQLVRGIGIDNLQHFCKAKTRQE